MKVLPALIVVLITAVSSAEGAEADPCLACHREKTPGLVSYWSGSRHAAEGIGCSRCHGENDDENHPAKDGLRVSVPVAICAECHETVTRTHMAGKHGIGFRAGRACTRNQRGVSGAEQNCRSCHEEGASLPRERVGCARFLAQTPEMQRQGCLACHRVESGCDTCHTAHDTDLALARNPAVCAPCHMGPDHPQYEMWKTSRHGVLFDGKGSEYAPVCQTCHMPEGSHNISLGITMGLAGQAYSPDRTTLERTRMVSVCSRCHTERFSRRSLDDADRIQKQAKALVDEAAAIVTDLDKEGLLAPSPAQRPPHPLAGPVLELGPQMLYEDLSRPEALFFRMKKFFYVITYKGVFHQNPDYAHWYGNAPLKLALSELRSEAAVLKAIKRLEERVDNLSRLSSVKAGGDQGKSLADMLRALREEYLRGEITIEEFNRNKELLLDEHGL